MSEGFKRRFWLVVDLAVPAFWALYFVLLWVVPSAFDPSDFDNAEFVMFVELLLVVLGVPIFGGIMAFGSRKATREKRRKYTIIFLALSIPLMLASLRLWLTLQCIPMLLAHIASIVWVGSDESEATALFRAFAPPVACFVPGFFILMFEPPIGPPWVVFGATYFATLVAIEGGLLRKAKRKAAGRNGPAHS